MKKKILAGVIAGVVLLGGVFAVSLNLSKTATELDPEAAFRQVSEIENADVVYLDNEAIALSDASGDNTALRSEALRAYNLVNEQRAAAGLPALVWNSNLESVAAVRAQENSILFSHTRPNGQPWYTVNSAIMGGENLAFGFNDADSVLSGWMNSPTHRENILWGEFTSIAISIYVDDAGTYYWAQEFGY